MPEHSSLAAALCAAQAEMLNATFNKMNPHFKNRYADLAAIRDTANDPLTKHGLTITHVMRIDPVKGFYLLGMLIHGKTKETLESEYPLPDARDKPQIIGSALTFGRRYTWSALVGIAAEDDDDAELATSAGKAKSSRQAKIDGDWERLIVEINSQNTTADLRAWGLELNLRCDRGEIPHAYKAHVRQAFRDRLLALGGKEGPPSTIVEDLKASLALTKEDEEIIDEDVTSSDPAAYLDDMDGAMANADVDALAELWKEHEAIKDILPPADQEKAEIIHDKHFRRAKADAAVKLAKGGFKRPG